MKKLISATLAASLALSLAACGSSASTDSVAASSESTAASSAAAESTAETSELAGTTLKVAASPTPHAEILEVAKEILAAKDITLDIQVYNDYVVPNTVVDDG
uniref:MetQ/NlpA family ABC transporter substrate-binding protein n=1 Tax=Gemmiger formicilis TaxID=745368 RepID=UPI004024E083